MGKNVVSANGASNGRFTTQTIWPIITTLGWIGWIAFGAAWYAGGLNQTVSYQAGLISRVQDEIDKVRIENRDTQSSLAKAIDDRNRFLAELERRVTDRSDAVNEKIASATATNTATQNMFLILERRVEMLEEARTKK